jgi:hypothetical protein
LIPGANVPVFLKVSCAAPMKPDSALSHITPRHRLDAATGFSAQKIM